MGRGQWCNCIEVDGKAVDIIIAGDQAPDPRMVSAVRQLIEGSGLAQAFKAWLEDMATKAEWSRFRKEIPALHPVQIGYTDIHRPGVGSMYLEVANPRLRQVATERAWRCRIVDGAFSDLGFDGSGAIVEE